MRHLIIPDTQITPGTPMDHLSWIGEYAAEKRPDVIVMLGDWYDMHSLSSYDIGKKAHEGARFEEDIASGNLGWKLLSEPIQREKRRTRGHKNPWRPRLVYLLGNHEQRIERYVNDFPHLEGTLGYHRFEHPGWERWDFLKGVQIDGFWYQHYFPNSGSGRPIGGSIENRLGKLGCSFVAGHEQDLRMGVRTYPGGRQWGFVAGACYLYNPSYRRGANREKRGILVLNEVDGTGDCDPMWVSLGFLCRKYEGVEMSEYLEKWGLEQ